MKRFLVMTVAIALATFLASAEDLPPASLANLAEGFRQTIRFTYSQTCRWGSGSEECDKGNGNALLEDLEDGNDVVVDSSGNFVVRSSDGIWIVLPDGTASKLADRDARTCQMTSSMSAVETRTDVRTLIWNGPMGALFVVTDNEESTSTFKQPTPDYCKDHTVYGDSSEVNRTTMAMIQVDYPASGGNAAINRVETRERAGLSLSRMQRLPSRITRRQPGNSGSDPYFFRRSRRPFAGTW